MRVNYRKRRTCTRVASFFGCELLWGRTRMTNSRLEFALTRPTRKSAALLLAAQPGRWIAGSRMQRVFSNALSRPYAFRSPVPGTEYAAWIISHDRTQTAAERDKIAAELVSPGCRYAVCSGFEASKWDDAVDLAFLDTYTEFMPTDDSFVMTSWHDQEPLIAPRGSSLALDQTVKSRPGWIRIGRLRVLGASFFVDRSLLVGVGILSVIAISSPIHSALFIGSYLLILVAHELGHAYVAYRRGYEVDAIGLTLLHGWCLCDAPQNERDAVFLAWGGVAAQLAIALPVLSVAFLLGDRSWGYLTPVVVFLGYLNVVIAIINLVPSDDSDGKVAWRLIPLLLQERRRQRAKRDVFSKSR